MSIPRSPRVQYEANPLQNVICQVRFPPILRIAAEAPAAFQERIRRDYPLFKERSELEPEGLPPEVAKLLGGDLPVQLRGEAIYNFLTEDGAWTVALTKQFLSLSTTKYRHWNEFRARFDSTCGSLVSEYMPAFFTRLGLRYRNIIRRSLLGLEQLRWDQLLRPEIAGELASPEMGELVEGAQHEVRLKAGSDTVVRMLHGLARVRETGEAVYFIDNDFSTTGRTEATDVLGRLDDLNREAGSLFRWCIQPRLHEAMGPRAV